MRIIVFILFSFSLSAQVGSYIGGVDVFKNTKGAYIEFKQVKLKAGSGISLQDSTLALNPSITINAPALANGDKGHILVSMAGTTWLLDTNSVNRYAISDTAVSFAKIVNFDAETLFGNPTGSTDSGRLIHLGDNLFFSNDTLHATGGGSSMPDGDYGDVTISGGSTVITINTDAVTTALINNDAVTFAKMQNLLSHTFIGRYSGTTGDPQTVHIGRGIQFSNDTVLVNESDFVNIDQTSINGLISDLSDKMDIADSNVYYYPYYTNPHNYLIGTDTAGLSSRINSKMSYSDTSSLSQRIELKLSISDSTIYYPWHTNPKSYLQAADILGKLNISDSTVYYPYASNPKGYLIGNDTVSLSNRINDKMPYSDTASLSNRIDTKLNISDTSGMLQNYVYGSGNLTNFFTSSISSHNISYSLSATGATYKLWGSPTNGTASYVSIDTNYIANWYKMVRSNLSAGSGITYDATTGVISSTGSGSGLTIGSTSVSSGTNTKILYNNSGTLGEYTISGSGNVAMTTSPTFTTPVLGTPTSGTLTNCTGLPIQAGTNGYLSPTRLNTTGTPSSSTYLRGDSTWASVTVSPNIITPSQITSDQDNYNPTGWSTCTIARISGDNGFRAITSFSAGSSGEVKTLVNVGSYPIYIPAEHPDGTAANRISYSEDIIIHPKQSIELIYDGTLSRWMPLTYAFQPNSKTIEYYAVGGDVTAADHNILNFTQTGTSAASAAQLPTSVIPIECNSMTTGTTATGNAQEYFGKGAGLFYTPAAHIVYESHVQIEDLSTGTDSFTVYANIAVSGSTLGALINNSFGFTYSHGVQGGAWQIYSRDGTTTSSASSGVTVSADTYYKLRMELDKSKTEIRYYINDAYVGRITSNIPSAAGNGFGARVGILKGVGTTPRLMYMYKLMTRIITI